MKSEYQEFLEFAKVLALKSGEIMVNYFNNPPSISLKANSEIVTSADESINDFVINEISIKFPDHSIIGEESSKESSSRYKWLCDPIDGTNLFSRSIPMCVFSLALTIDGNPVVGVIYSPFLKNMYHGVEGGGAFLNGDKISVKSSVQKNNVMNVDWWPNAELDAINAAKYLSEKYGIYFLSPGSTTHCAALVANGSLSASIFPGTKGKAVDIAAAKVIVEQAGGKVTDFFGKDQKYETDITGAVVSNGVMHDEIIDAIRRSMNL